MAGRRRSDYLIWSEKSLKENGIDSLIRYFRMRRRGLIDTETGGSEETSPTNPTPDAH